MVFRGIARSRMGIGSPAMQCHEQGWICLALGHPVLAYPIRNVIASVAWRSRFSIVAGKRDCFVASLLAMTIKFRCHQFRKSRARCYCAESWGNSRDIRRKALRFSALPGSTPATLDVLDELREELRSDDPNVWLEPFLARVRASKFKQVERVV